MDKATAQYSFGTYQLPAILWAALIFILSSIPSSLVPSFKVFDYDKVIHFGIYFLFSFFTYRAIRYQNRFAPLARHALLWTVLLIIVYGASDEFHQYFVPGRQADVFDLLADTAGAVVLVAGVRVWERMHPAAH